MPMLRTSASRPVTCTTRNRRGRKNAEAPLDRGPSLPRSLCGICTTNSTITPAKGVTLASLPTGTRRKTPSFGATWRCSRCHGPEVTQTVHVRRSVRGPSATKGPKHDVGYAGLPRGHRHPSTHLRKNGSKCATSDGLIVNFKYDHQMVSTPSAIGSRSSHSPSSKWRRIIFLTSAGPWEYSMKALRWVLIDRVQQYCTDYTVIFLYAGAFWQHV